MGGGVSAPVDDDGGAKAMGDTCFRLQDYLKAVYFYSKAVADVSSSDQETLSKLLSNRAAAHHEAGSHEKALLDAEEVIAMAPHWAKGYFRAAKAALALGRTVLAARYVEKAMALAPDDTSLPALRAAALAPSSSSSPASSSSSSARQVSRAAGPSWCYSWGNDESSQLGLGLAPSNKSLPTPVASFAGVHLVAVSCGASHTLAVSSLGEVFAWGNNEFGQLGIPNLSGCVATPTLVPALVGVRVAALAAGAGHNCALTGDGQIYSWGINRQGQCGLGHTENQAKPALVAALGRPAVAATCGIAHTAFLLDDGSLALCGSNQFGQLGLGRSFAAPDIGGSGTRGGGGHTDLAEARVLARAASHAALPLMVLTPVVVLETSGDFRVAHVACGGAHTLLVDTAGRVLSAGSNSCGQLGRAVGPGPVGPGSDPHAVADILHGRALDYDDDPCFGAVYVPPRGDQDGSRPCALVACGEEFSLCVARDHSVFTFGLGIAGQMGDGDFEGHSRPHLVQELEGKQVEEAICSQGQVLAVTAEGTVWTWGTPGDRAHMATLDPSVAILRPETVAAFSRKKKIHTMSCGRKHYVLLVAGIYGPLCFVKSGLGAARSCDGAGDGNALAYGEKCGEEEDADMRCVAGDKVALVVQCVDFHGNATDSSHGVTFNASVEHESIDYEFSFRKQCGSASALKLPLPGMEWDDNLDGTVGGTMRLYVAGQYRVAVTLNQQHIRGSPFTVAVQPGPVSPAQCDVWWSKALVAQAEAPDGDGKGSGPDAPVRLHAHAGESVVFAVSLRDRYRNKVSDTAGTAGLGVEVTLQGKEQRWAESTRGVVPCALLSPKEPGEYTFNVTLMAYDGPGSDVITYAVLAISAAPAKPADDAAPGAAAAAPAAAAVAEPAAPSELSPEDRKLLDAVSRQEMTRKRARDALLRQQAQLARERQAARERKEAIRRTGGGFVIQFSKEI